MVVDANEDKAAQDQAAANEASTLDNVTAKMAEIQARSDGDDFEAQDTADEADDLKQVDDATDTGDTDSKDDQDDAADGDSDGSADEDSPMLPSGHRRAALARGYTNEEIDFYLEQKPEEATARFGNIYTDWQKDNSEWSDRGRRLMQDNKTTSEDGDSVKPIEALGHLDTEKLIEEHPGSEDLIKSLVAPLNGVIDRVNHTVEQLTGSQEFLQKTEQNALQVSIDEFLGSDDMKSFADTYGAIDGQLTDTQQKSRMELFGQADEISTGAKDHGRDITVHEALERAHAILSQGTRDETIRQEIRDSMTKRTKSTKSSHRKTETPDGDSGGEISDDELVSRTEERLATLRGQ